MQLLLYITIIILFLLVALMVMPLRVRIAYHRQGVNDQIIFEMSLWKLPKYKLNTALINFQTGKDSSDIKFKSKNKKSGFLVRKLVTTLASFPKKGNNLKDGDFTLKIPYNICEIKKMATKFYQQYQRYWPGVDYLLHRTQCRRFEWRTNIGFGDAAVTGWVSGILWMLKPLLLGKLSSLVSLTKRPVVMVQPEFNEKRFDTDFDCIFEVRMGHIMVTGIKLAFRK